MRLGLSAALNLSAVLELSAVLGLGLVACSEEAPPGLVPGENCGYEADDPLTFARVELDSSTSAEGCPEVTAEQANGADEPDCERALDGCVLVVDCNIVPTEGLTVRGRGRLSLVDGGSQLAGRLDVSLGGATCRYDILADLD